MKDRSRFSYRMFSKKRLLVLLFASLICLAAFIANVLVGSSGLPLGEILTGIFRPAEAGARTNAIVWTMRVPIGVMGLLVGCALGTAGAAMQTILDNPLASPYTLGISAGAGFGASLALLSGLGSLSVLDNLLVPVSAFAFSLLACFGIYAISKRKNFTSSMMVLAGIGMVFFFQALQSFIQYLASPEALQGIIFWTFGSLSKANWVNIPILALVFVSVFLLIAKDAWMLTAMKLGDSRAKAMGVDVEKLRKRMFFLISLLTATAVAFVGSIGFIGIVGPHIARILVGEDQRFFLPMSALCGACLLSAASVAAKLIVPGTLFPIGILTSMIGVPFFFLLILRKREG